MITVARRHRDESSDAAAARREGPDWGLGPTAVSLSRAAARWGNAQASRRVQRRTNGDFLPANLRLKVKVGRAGIKWKRNWKVRE
jgi:hypothetical protein